MQYQGVGKSVYMIPQKILIYEIILLSFRVNRIDIGVRIFMEYRLLDLAPSTILNSQPISFLAFVIREGSFEMM